ncbi:hypothetical protein Tco_1534165 [Tanacetum coccineum]
MTCLINTINKVSESKSDTQDPSVVKEKGVSPWLDLIIVRWAQRTWGKFFYPIIVSLAQAGLDSFTQAPVCSFHESIGLRMLGKALCDIQLFTPILEWVVVELFTVVRNYFPWETEAAYYVVPHELLHLIAGDCRHGFRLYPFREIVHNDYKKLDLSWSLQERTNYVNSPLVEWPRSRDGG